MNNREIFDFNGGLKLVPVDPDISRILSLWALWPDFPEKELLTGLMAELQGFRRIAASPAAALAMRKQAERETKQVYSCNAVSIQDLPKRKELLPLTYDTIQTSIIRYAVRQLEDELIKNKSTLLNWEVTGPDWERGTINIKGAVSLLKPAEPDDKSAQIFNDIAGKYTR